MRRTLNNLLHSEIASLVDAFLESGREITKCPSGRHYVAPTVNFPSLQEEGKCPEASLLFGNGWKSGTDPVGKPTLSVEPKPLI